MPAPNVSPPIASTLTPSAIASAGSVGTSPAYATGDHTHPGVHSVNGQLGDVLVPSMAQWATAVRYWFVDNDSGNDNNVGYIDGSAGSTFTTLQTGPVAIKTLEHLYEIMPLFGNGRNTVVLMKARSGGANYLKKDGATQDILDVSRFVGYTYLTFRGSTDLSNSTTDRATCGFITAVAGPNGDGTFTVDTGPSTTVIPVVGGGLTADASVQFRLRVTNGTRAGQCRVITSNSTTAFTLGNALTGGAPTAGDNVIVERPGVRVAQIIATSTAAVIGDPSASFSFGVAIVGVAATSTATGSVSVSGVRYVLCGCEIPNATTNAGLFVADVQRFSIQDNWLDETNTTQTVGMGVRLLSNYTIGNVMSGTISAFGQMNPAGLTGQLSQIRTGVIFAKSYILGGVSMTACGGAGVGMALSPGTTEGFVVGDISTSNALPRLVQANSAQMRFFACGSFSLRRWSVEGFSAVRPILFGSLSTNGSVGATYCIDGMTPAAGTILGIYVNHCWGANFLVGLTIANTSLAPTGGDGDIAAGDGTSVGVVAVMFADLANTGFRDPQGNLFIGPGGLSAGQAVIVKNTTGGACAPGDVVRATSTATGTINQVVAAQGDSITNATGALMAMVTSQNNNQPGFAVAVGQGMVPLTFDGTPTIGATAYLSTGTAKRATTTLPVVSGTNQRRSIGTVVGSNGTTGYVIGPPERNAVTADGLSDSLVSQGRFDESKGATVASGGTVTLGNDGNFFEVSGTTTVNFITTTGWRSGARVDLYFQGALTLTNQASSPPGGTAVLRLTGATNATVTAGTTISLRYDAANSWWREISRSAG